MGTSAAALARDDVDPATLEPGFTFRVYDIGYSMNRLWPLLEDQTPNFDERRDVLDAEGALAFGGFEDHFVVEALGFLRIDEAGSYGFRLTSDDGSRLRINGDEIILHDGVHGATSKEGDIELEAGLHAFEVDMFENAGGEVLRLEWRPPGAEEFALVPKEAFRIERGITRVVSPGFKRIDDGKGPVRAGDGLPLQSVHPSFMLEDIRPEGFEPQVGGMAFLPDGRLVIADFEPVNNGIFREEPNGTLWGLENLASETDEDVQVVKIADGFHDPAGVAVVDGVIYVSHRTDITRLADEDGDGVFETREVFVTPWISDNYHHFSFGLVHHEGWLYGTLSTSIYFGNTIESDNVMGEVVSMNGPNPEHRGTCYRVNVETRDVEFLAGGFRTPNGLGVGPGGGLYVADNQGAWLPSSKFIRVQEGEFYGHYNGTSEQKSDRYPEGGYPSLHSEHPPTPPTVWLPQNEIANSPSESLLIREGEFAGQMLMGEITMGGIRRIFLEEVGGVMQGCVLRHSQGFEAGVNRLVSGPDGCLYVGMTGAGGNWSWRGKRFGLQRLRPVASSAFEIHSMRAAPGGFDLTFTRPVSKAWLENPASYDVAQWHYRPTPQYGGPKYDEQRLVVASAKAAGDRRSVRLSIPGLRERHVVHLRTDPTSDFGEEIWSTEAWYTLNRKPADIGADGYVHWPLDRGDLARFRDPVGDWALFEDVSLDPSNPKRLAGRNGRPVAALNGESGRTDHLVTDFEHGDVELHLEFQVSEGSNSGVYLMGRYEIQILDSYGKPEPRHDDCGGLYQRWDPERGAGNEGYDGVPPRVNAARPAGEWQTYDIVFRAPRFDRKGKKVENARFVRVEHNGVVVHENVEAPGPTRAALFKNERPFGPLMLQGDHGPVAYREIRLRPLRLR